MQEPKDPGRTGGDDPKGYKAKFDAASKRHFCFRCGMGPVIERIKRSASTPIGVVDLDHWLCQSCSGAFAEFLGGVRKARWDSEAKRADAALVPGQVASKLGPDVERVESSGRIDNRPAAPSTAKKRAGSKRRPAESPDGKGRSKN